jgi:glutamine synthetase
MHKIPSDIERLRVYWCDVHGHMRSKTLMRRTIPAALASGITMPGTQMLKDTSDRTAFPVFDTPALHRFSNMPELAQFANAANMRLALSEPDPSNWLRLPWDNSTAIVRANCLGSPWDTRQVLEKQLQSLAKSGWQMRCGLELEFHVYRLTATSFSQTLNPETAQWPGLAPEVSMLHGGYRLLSDELMSQCEPVMRCIEQTAHALNLPLSSLEIEFGPSQLEAVFEVSDALVAADSMVLFRNIVRQALLREGYYASFVCRPPFNNIMSSGWHLHQSLVDANGENLFMPTREGAPLSALGEHYLAGQLAHAPAMAAFCVSQVNAYERFRPMALAPQDASWGRDSRSAMIRVLGGPNDSASRIENRLGEPCANPYLFIAAQLSAGMAGIHSALSLPAEGASVAALPGNMSHALANMQASSHYQDSNAGFGASFCQYFASLKHQEWERFNSAQDKHEFIRREYFARF